MACLHVLCLLQSGLSVCPVLAVKWPVCMPCPCCNVAFPMAPLLLNQSYYRNLTVSDSSYSSTLTGNISFVPCDVGAMRGAVVQIFHWFSEIRIFASVASSQLTSASSLQLTPSHFQSWIFDLDILDLSYSPTPLLQMTLAY